MTHSIEDALREAGQFPSRFGPTDPVADRDVHADRIAENLLMIHAELDAPRESRLARLLRRLGTPDLTIPVVTATPALRRSWFVAVALAVLFALGGAGNQTGAPTDRIGVFLTVAPLVPLAGVALAFGRRVDPTHDLVIAAPRDTFRVFLIRSATVLAASMAILLIGSLLLPVGGIYRLAWLLPACALTGLTMALSIGRDARRIAGGLAMAWLTLVTLVTNTNSTAVMFGPATQVMAAITATATLVLVMRRRSRIETEIAS